MAWWITKVICAVQTAIQGGKIFADNAIPWVTNLLGRPAIDLDETMLDEYIGWTLAALGVYWQISSGFQVGFFSVHGRREVVVLDQG